MASTIVSNVLPDRTRSRCQSRRAGGCRQCGERSRAYDRWGACVIDRSARKDARIHRYLQLTNVCLRGTSARERRAARSTQLKRMSQRHAGPFGQGHGRAAQTRANAVRVGHPGLVGDHHGRPLSQMSGRQRQNIILRQRIKLNFAQALPSKSRCWF